MNRTIRNWALSALSIGVIGLTASVSALAAGTTAGTTVANQAQVDYDVSGVPQTTIDSDGDGNFGNGPETTDFLVDRLLDFTVVEVTGTYNHTGSLSPQPGNTAAVLAWTVTNNGNSVQDFSLATLAGADPFGGTDNFDVGVSTIYVDANANGVYNAGVDIEDYIDELAEDDSIVVFMVSTIPLAQADGDIAAYDLTAQVAEGGAAAAQGADITSDDAGDLDDPALVQDVFGSGLSGTGTVTDTDAYEVVTSQITISKNSTVLDDPINGGTNPKAIPGAIVEYCINVANDVGASATASNVSITDSIKNEVVGGGGTENIDFLTDVYGAAGDISYVFTPNAGAPTTLELTEEADADQGEYNQLAGPNDFQVIVDSITLAPGDQVDVCFQVEIQ